MCLELPCKEASGYTCACDTTFNVADLLIVEERDVPGCVWSSGLDGRCWSDATLLLKKCRLRMGHGTRVKRMARIGPRGGGLLSLDLSFGRFLQLDRLVAARSFRDQSSFLVVLDVEVIQR